MLGKLGVSELKATSCFNGLRHVPSWLQTLICLLGAGITGIHTMLLSSCFVLFVIRSWSSFLSLPSATSLAQVPVKGQIAG